MLFDMHVHSTFSKCSSLTLEDILGSAKAKGLDGVCITDHNTMAARQWIREGLQSNGLCIIIGQEYTTGQGDFLLFGPYENLPPHLGAVDLLRYVRSSGGVAVAAHPFRKRRPVAKELLHSGLCKVIEHINGRNTRKENDQTRFWLQSHPLRSICGSDAHSIDELGQVPVRFHIPIQSRSELIHALKVHYR